MSQRKVQCGQDFEDLGLLPAKASGEPLPGQVVCPVPDSNSDFADSIQVLKNKNLLTPSCSLSTRDSYKGEGQVVSFGIYKLLTRTQKKNKQTNNDKKKPNNLLSEKMS